jgi:uncharacterized protein
MRHRARTMAVAAALVLGVTACGDGDGEAAGDGDLAPSFLTIATAGTGGTFYAYGGTYASIVNDAVDGVEANAESTGGSVENVRLVSGGESDVGIAQADVVYDAVNGQGDFDGEPQPIRVIGGIYPNYLQLAVRDGSGIETIDDLAGERVSVGPAGGGQEVTLRTVADALGMSFDDFAAVENLGFDDQNLAFGDNNIDVGNYMTSLHAGTINELAATVDIDFVSFTSEEIEQISEAAPYFIEGVIPGGIYDGVDEDVEYVPALWNWLVVHEDLDAELAYSLTEALYDNQAQLESTTPAAEETQADNLAEVTSPLHPGTAEYAEDQGIDLPDVAHEG